MMSEFDIDTDVLVIGAGAAGMSAAVAAAQAGSRVLLADRSLIGRGGATIMAQMTVAAALGEQTEDHWRHHYEDTLKAGRGLCSEPLARLLCEEGVEAIRLLESWGVGWARDPDRLRQVHAPGHDRPRCVYVDYLNTGPAVAKTLRTQVARHESIRRIGDLYVVDILLQDGAAAGALALHLDSGRPVVIRAGAVIVATGGLTRLYRRSSASSNMGGDGYALAARAGARLIDMEFVQFFPIGHLAPRLVGLDPIMWDPFRYKLGGELLNGRGDPFVGNYDSASLDTGRYVVTRDAATYAIIKEVAAGRGSPAGGAYLSFRHVPPTQLREAFGPIIDTLADNGIDLTRDMVEVAPIAHYHMGGVRVGLDMQSDVPRLYAAGEAVGGANGANRLSGNAITEALAFGLRAGRGAAAAAVTAPDFTAAQLREAASQQIAALQQNDPRTEPPNAAALLRRLQETMQADVGPFRTRIGLLRAQARLDALRDELGDLLPGSAAPHDARRIDALDLRSMLLVARAVVDSALAREESRGAHQREDFPGLEPTWQVNQTAALDAGEWRLARQPVWTAAASRELEGAA
ncbi:FAD-binding protein [Achromobacter insolitus]|jgi:succinate dehydrogenase/fumarate reductase flavoprotein subunit|uniref:Fumarate reductase flavoprotein subunit n=2 Tax=Achromobacter insolitus TaxID=217204 RepID=A0A6S7F7J7_9BURK|nr:FAD-binding protein [Achromobacter insolitus]NGT13102.1 FAD-binding protein [Achromobacter insolitus]OAD12658.1 succinate dehydrogenase [Achromobacter insolitus]QEK91218.1 FAD-binding protein [Achromobacter insolitus]CAB3930261.1 Fumarate reductase flavoprotein subunit [Achromobacter insolitus]CAB3933254.1 Fumarate reductase flavoprotein subunit [Achromobacter insolitus]